MVPASPRNNRSHLARPSPYCASHIVPLEELTSDLANPATTPNSAGVRADYHDATRYTHYSLLRTIEVAAAITG